MPEPRSNAPFLTVGQDGKELTVNDAIATIAALTVGAAIARTDTPPATPVEGDLYIVGTAPTGAWATRNNQLALSRANSPAGWKFFPPVTGWHIALMTAQGKSLRWNGANWVPVGASGQVESEGSSTASLSTAANTNIPFVAATGTSGLNIATGKITHPTGRFAINVFCALSGIASTTYGSIDLYVKAGATEKMIGFIEFRDTPGSRGSVSALIELDADAADPIELIIKNPIAMTSLNGEQLWVQCKEL